MIETNKFKLIMKDKIKKRKVKKTKEQINKEIKILNSHGEVIKTLKS